MCVVVLFCRVPDEIMLRFQVKSVLLFIGPLHGKLEHRKVAQVARRALEIIRLKIIRFDLSIER